MGERSPRWLALTFDAHFGRVTMRSSLFLGIDGIFLASELPHRVGSIPSGRKIHKKSSRERVRELRKTTVAPIPVKQ